MSLINDDDGSLVIEITTVMNNGSVAHDEWANYCPESSKESNSGLFQKGRHWMLKGGLIDKNYRRHCCYPLDLNLY